MYNFYCNIYIEKIGYGDIQILASNGVFICSQDSLSSVLRIARSNLDSMLENIKEDFNISPNVILSSNKTHKFKNDSNTVYYNIYCELINLSYLSTDGVTERYNITFDINNHYTIDRYIISPNGEEVRKELSDCNPLAGTIFEIGEYVKYIKDPFHHIYQITGKIGRERLLSESESSNLYSITTDEDGRIIYFDDVHESELTLVNKKDED